MISLIWQLQARIRLIVSAEHCHYSRHSQAVATAIQKLCCNLVEDLAVPGSVGKSRPRVQSLVVSVVSDLLCTFSTTSRHAIDPDRTHASICLQGSMYGGSRAWSRLEQTAVMQPHHYCLNRRTRPSARKSARMPPATPFSVTSRAGGRLRRDLGPGLTMPCRQKQDPSHQAARIAV